MRITSAGAPSGLYIPLMHETFALAFEMMLGEASSPPPPEDKPPLSPGDRFLFQPGIDFPSPGMYSPGLYFTFPGGTYAFSFSLELKNTLPGKIMYELNLGRNFLLLLLIVTASVQQLVVSFWL